MNSPGTTKEKLDKFLKRVEMLIDDCGRFNRLGLNDHVNQFYFMQKCEELRLLQDQVAEAQKRLDFFRGRFESEYGEVFRRWQRDARWLIRNREEPLDKTIN